MTISKFYSTILRSRRTHVPTIDESRRDYRRMRQAQIAGIFGPS
ncbi:MAG: hypothetical protein V3S31_01645 [Dehalococcoidia bacterium]